MDDVGARPVWNIIIAGGGKEDLKKKIHRSLIFETDTFSTWQEAVLTSKAINKYLDRSSENSGSCLYCSPVEK